MLVGMALLVAMPTASAIDSISYGEQVIGPQKHAINVRALGPDAFGEEISAYTGGISFSQTDVALPGNNALEVAVRRRLIVDGNKSPSKPNDENLWRGYMFGEWELDLPYLTGMYSETAGWVVNTTTPNARCSSPATFNQFRPKDVSIGDVYFTSYNFWNGISLNVPGSGEQGLLHRPAGGPLPMPTGSWTPLTTRSQWHFSCLSTLPSGQAGEGFLGLAPDGTKYWFNWMVSYPERPLHGTAAMLLQNGITFRTHADLVRRNYRLYVTRVEDRFGNWVNYGWSGANLNSITASDGRSISLAYANGRIASVTAGSQVFQYAYADGLLSSVTLPDSSSWTFSTSAMVNLARFVPLSDANPFDHPMSCQLMRRLKGDEADIVLTHPAGIQGTFRLGYKRLMRTNLDGSTMECDYINGVETNGVASPTTFWSHMPRIPNRSDVLALKTKTMVGPGVPSQAWTYQHVDAYAVTPGWPVAGTRTVTTTDPDGSSTIEVYGTDALANEAQLLSQEARDGQNVLLRRVDNTYVQTSEMASMPFPDWMGQPLAYEFIRGRSDYNRPMKRSVTRQQARDFIYQVDTFDVLVRPKQVTRKSQPSP
ncbi:hypothetical protein ASD72_01740 [Pseudoxanthomonas sp. Root630]|nr:hypothetical protein ASD72_01740 [Pseudoxanthomonas sp. Root630]